jgi:beta-lactamase class A
MKKTGVICFVLVGVFSLQMCKPSSHRFKNEIEKLAKASKGTLGVGMMIVEYNDSLEYNGELHLPMQSVFKFPIAMAILNKVDSAGLSLDKKIHFVTNEMDTNTWSPFRNACAGKDTDVTIGSLLNYMVAKSDNIACDALIKELGGPDAVNTYIHHIGATGITIVANEADMHKAWDVQYKNWCEPRQMMYLLYNFYKGKYLSKLNTDLLLRIMDSTSTSPKRLKGMLPKGTIVAHKSGSGPTNKNGITAATNDVGIITLPDGKHLIIAAFITDSQANEKTRDSVIAAIASKAYSNIEYYGDIEGK